MTRPWPVAVVVLALLVPGGAAAARPGATSPTTAPPRDERIRELQEAIGEASAEEASSLQELVDIRERRSELDASINALESQISDVTVAMERFQAEVVRLGDALTLLERRIDATTNRLDAAETRAQNSAAELYATESGGVPVRVGALEASNFSDVYTGTHYLGYVTKDLWGRVDELLGLKDVISQLQAQATEQRAAAETARVEAENRRTELDGLQGQQQAERAEVAEQESKERALIESIRERKDDFTSELAALQASSNAITSMLAARQKGQTKATSFKVARPVPGPISSSFGARVHPILGDTRMHNGIDMSASYGSSIKAAYGGVVAFAGVRSGYGNTVIIDHGNQYATLYAHASSLQVSEGQRVTQGQTVALVGATGLATAPHLHFEVRLLGVPQNPVNYL